MITIAAIQAEVARAFRIPVEKMSEPINLGLGKIGRNTYEFSHPRQAAMYLAVNLTRHSLKRIGYYFGGRDHSTVLWAIRAVEKRMERDKDLSQKLLGIVERLKSPVRVAA